MNAAVGPLSTSPPTIGLTATTGAAAASERVVDAGTASIGAIEAIGLEGPMTIARAPGDRREHRLARRGLLGAAELEALDRPAARARGS